MRRLMMRLIEAYGVRNRRKKGRIVRQFAADQRAERVLFVGSSGAWGPRGHIVERAALLPGRTLVVACDVWPKIKIPWHYVCGDGRRLPFRDDAFDLVLSNAVIEHVGDQYDQQAFVAEHGRVARTWIITTPNRWFPVETHTGAVFLHWLAAWRARQARFSRLLSKGEFRLLLPPGSALHGRPWSPTFVATGERGPSPP